MIRVAICDYSVKTYHTISKCLEQYALSSHEPIKIHYYRTVEELLISYHGQYDILFLEIMLNKKSSIDTVKCIRRIDERVFIVFVTRHNNFGAESYQVRATNYLLKPFSLESVEKTLQQIHVELLKEKYYIIAKSKGKIVKLPIEDILYIDYYNHRLTFHMFDETSEKIYGSYQQLFAQKHTECLYQIHKSYVINMFWIERIENKTVYFRNVQQGFMISRKRWKDFLSAYQLFLDTKLFC